MIPCSADSQAMWIGKPRASGDDPEADFVRRLGEA